VRKNAGCAAKLVAYFDTGRIDQGLYRSAGAVRA
jgi:hypothetical protein